MFIFESESINTENVGKYEVLRLSQLSDGYKNIVNLAADIAFRCIQLNPRLSIDAVKLSEGIVLIDEIDMHLHSSRQERVVNDLKTAFPNIQFVATTHSPFIIQTLAREELKDLDNKDDLSIQTDESPKDMTIASIVTEVIGLESVRSDDFEKRYESAKVEIEKLRPENGELTEDIMIQIGKKWGEVLVNETNDPIYKAYLELKKGEQDETD